MIQKCATKIIIIYHYFGSIILPIVYFFTVNIQNRTYLKKLGEMMADTSGTIELHYLKTHFIGPSGLGKTTTRQRLVGSITNLSLLPEDQRKRCSTLLAECEQVLAFVDKSGTKLEFKASSSLEEETQFIFSYLMSCEPIEDSTVSNTSTPKEQPKKETTDPKKQTQLKIDETATVPKETVSPTPVSPTPEPPEKVVKVTTVDVGKVVSRLRSIVGSGEYTKELLNKVLLNLVDIGGQPGFVEMFPFLSKGAGIFLVFFRLDKDLDDMCQVSYERGKDKITPYDSTYTSRETLSQILSAISHHTKIDSDIDREQCSKLGNLGSAKPVATLIGTFKDELAMQIKVDLLYEKCCASTKAVSKSDSTTASKTTTSKTTASKSDSTTASKSDSNTTSKSDSSTTASKSDSTTASKSHSTTADKSDSTTTSKSDSTTASKSHSTTADKSDSTTSSKSDSTTASKTTTSKSDSTTASKTTASKSDSTTASNTTTSKSDSTTASKSDSTTASKSESTTADKSDGTTADKSYGTTASKSDGTTASKSDGTTGNKSDGNTASKSDGTTASKSDGTTGNKSDGNTASKSDGTTSSKSDSTTASKSDSTTADKSLNEHEQKKAIRNILTQLKSDANVSAEDMAAIEQTVSQHLNSDTFKKDVQDRLEQKLTEKNEAVSKITSKFEKLLSNPKDKKFIAVDNYEGTDSDMEPLREHLHGIFSSYFKDAKLRIRPQQLLLGVVLRKEYDIVSMEECIRIGTEGLKMTEKEVRFTVWYLDRFVGALIYHPEIKDKDGWFGNFVICNPQVVFNSLSVLVVNPLLELHSEEGNIQFNDNERKNWILKGQFLLKTITRCHSEENQGVKKDQLIPVEKLLILLEHSHLLAKITTVEEDHTTEEVETTYFIPAILKCASREELTKPPPTGIDTPSPIKITFKPQYVPIGVFCAMISELVSRGSTGILGMTWKLATDTSVKRNLVSFHIDESAKHFVTLIANVDCYEIRIIRQDRDHTMHELCSYVLSTLLLVMKDISPLLTPIIAFDCYCGKHEDGSKLCLLTPGADPCFKCTSKVSLSPHQECWFAEVSEL